ncbi:acid phosphatase/Vanadium-dependent haloperoxidase [Hymenopellis radicata]|nr:acid phosphatase/Vanadium-dependent haloperoxidase [Hymenopellis radicata]
MTDGKKHLVDELLPRAETIEQQPPTVEYDEHLTRWRARMRSVLVKAVENESKFIAQIQERVRTPLLDAYFTYSSILGTDSFFILSLPIFFFFGHDDLGRGLLLVLAIGGYASSFLKDLFCSPRPFSPPVTRLTVMNHHLEYGFPSTHTTHSSSIALYLLLNTAFPYHYYCVYACTIIFGRVYLGMHTFTDCAAGLALGALAVGIQGLPLIQRWESWVFRGGAEVPLVLVAGFWALLELVPMPADACPCFDDAVLSGAVALGSLLGRWALGPRETRGKDVIMPGSGWAFSSGDHEWVRIPGDAVTWWSLAALKMVVGIILIFLWRMIAKVVLKRLLRVISPPSRQKLGVGNKIIYRHRSDTLTKVIVYAGVAILCCDVIPDVFDSLGLGVKSWP